MGDVKDAFYEEEYSSAATKRQLKKKKVKAELSCLRGFKNMRIEMNRQTDRESGKCQSGKF